MWFIGSFALVILMFLLSWLLGHALLSLLGFRLQVWRPESAALGVLTGTAILILTSGWMSWLGLPMRDNGIILTIALSLSSLLILTWRWRQAVKKVPCCTPEFRTLVPMFALLALVGVVSYLGMLSLLRENAFDPYNDTVASISLGEYLQDHAFRAPVDFKIQSPVAAMTAFYQMFNLRMGVHFFLALVQSWVPFSRSIDVFPAVSAFGTILDLLAVYLCCRWMIRMPVFHSLCGCLFGFTNLSQAHYVAEIGMMNQLYGVAFFFTGLTLLGGVFHAAERHSRRWIILLGLISASLVSAYNEMLPIYGVVLLVAYGIRLAHSSCRSWSRFFRLLLSGGVAAALGNLELLRAYKNITLQMQLVDSPIGWHIPYTTLQFIRSWLGLYPGHGDERYFREVAAQGVLFWFMNALALVVIAAVAVGLVRAMMKLRYLRYAEYSSALFIYLVLVIYFTFLVKNPFIPGQMGQTWSISKLVTFSFPLGICAFLMAFRNVSLARWPLLAIVITSAVGFWPIHDAISHGQTEMSRQLTGSENDPFGAYVQLAERVRTMAAGRSLKLMIPDTTPCRHFEVIAYYLYPEPVAANWQTPGCTYLGQYEGRYFLNPPPPYAFTLTTALNPQSVTNTLPAGIQIQQDSPPAGTPSP